MKVDLFVNTQSHYSKKNNPNKSNNCELLNNKYATDSFSPSFTGNKFTGIFKKLLPQKIRLKLQEIAQKSAEDKAKIVRRTFEISPNSVLERIKDEWEGMVDASILKSVSKNIKRYVDKETYEFADKLLERVGINGKERVADELFCSISLLEKFKENPKARGLMLKTLDRERIAESSHYSLIEMAHDIFGDEYRGTLEENLLINQMVDSGRFSALGINRTLTNFTPDKQEAFDLLAAKKITVTDNTDFRKLSKIVDEAPEDEIEEFMEEADLPSTVEHFLDENCTGVDDLFEVLSEEKMGAFKLLLNKNYSVNGMTEILEAYTPEKLPRLKKAVNAIDADGFPLFDYFTIARLIQAP